MRLRRTLLLAVIPFAAACTNGNGETVKTPETAKTPEAGGDVPTTGRVAANSPNAGKDERAGRVRDFAGDDPGKTVAITGKRAWTVGAGDSWTIGLYDYVGADGTRNVFKGAAGEPHFAIPGAYTLAAVPARGLAKGAIVLVPSEGATTCGRVASAGDTRVEVGLLGESGRTVTGFSPDEVLPLDGKLGFGAPVAYRAAPDVKSWSVGTLVYQDGTNAWLEGATKVPLAQVKPLELPREIKVGDRIFAVPQLSDAFVPGAVTRILDEGLQYEIKTADGALKIADVCSVTTSL